MKYLSALLIAGFMVSPALAADYPGPYPGTYYRDPPYAGYQQGPTRYPSRHPYAPTSPCDLRYPYGTANYQCRQHIAAPPVEYAPTPAPRYAPGTVVREREIIREREITVPGYAY